MEPRLEFILSKSPRPSPLRSGCFCRTLIMEVGPCFSLTSHLHPILFLIWVKTHPFLLLTSKIFLSFLFHTGTPGLIFSVGLKFYPSQEMHLTLVHLCSLLCKKLVKGMLRALIIRFRKEVGGGIQVIPLY